MPLLDVHIGPFSAVYVGLATGVDVLTQLTGVTTGANRVSVNIPETFNYSLNNSLQSGPVQIKADLTFLSDDPDAWRLAYGNWLTASYEDSSSQFVTLTLLMIHPDEDSESSVLIPVCYALKSIQSDYSKTSATTLGVSFVWQDLNRYNVIYYKRSASDLATILGPRSPI